MYKVIVNNNLIIANIPDKDRADYLAEVFQGEIVKIKSGNYKFKNYLKKVREPQLCETCKKTLNIKNL